MKRDNEYLRELLFRMEACETSYYITRRFIGMKPEDEKEPYHLDLLCDDGYVAILKEGSDSYRLTSKGHDFIAAIRDPDIWKKTIKTIADAGGNTTIDIMLALAKGFLILKFKEVTGIDLPI